MKIKVPDFDSIKQIALKASVDELYIPLQGKSTTNIEEEPFDLADKIKQFFVFDETNPNDPRVILLMGDTGAGKSVFVQQLHQQLWKDYEVGNPISLSIPLAELENPFEEAVEEVLRKQGFEDFQISEMKSHEKFIFIVDGYDELHLFQNCYVTNKWNQWNAKVLIACRSQALYYQKDYEKYFTPFKGEKRLPLLLRKIYIAPFSQDQISAYVKKYQALHSDSKISEEDFSKIPGLAELITTPILLHLAVEAMPEILAGQIDDQKMTQAKLYDVFIECWFARQVEKLRITGHLSESEENTKLRFWDYCKRLAQKMHEKEMGVIPYQGKKRGGRLFGKQVNDNTWEPFFNENTKILRSACPLKKMGTHYYGFIHASFVEYFATRAMYEEIQAIGVAPVRDFAESPNLISLREPQQTANKNDKEEMPLKSNQLSGAIFQRLFTREIQTIRFLADRIEQAEVFKRKMIAIVEASKISVRYAVGSANAITALIRAGVMFNKADLSKIKISGADVSGGYFDQADLSHADLSNTLMMNIWLRKANLNSCNLTGINFGEYPCLIQDQNVDCFDYREDLQRLVSGCKENIILWDTLSGEQLGVFKGHAEFIYGVKFNSSGTWIVSGSADKTVRLWDLESESQIALLEGHDDYVSSVDVSSDDSLIVSGSDDGTIRLWDVKEAKQKAILRGHEESVNSVHFTLNGKQIISASADNTIRIWDVVSEKELSILQHEAEVHTGQISQNGRLVVSGCDDDSLQVWDVTEKKIIAELHGHEDYVNCLAICPDGRRVVSGSHDSTVRIWDIASKKMLSVLQGHETEVHCVQFSSDAKQVISGSWDKTIRFWDISNERMIGRRRGHERSIACLHVSLDGKRVVTGSGDYSLRVWEILSGIEIVTLRGHAGFVSCVQFSSDGKLIVSGGWDHSIRIWNIDDKKEIKILKGHNSSVNSVAFSPNGKKLISCSGKDNGEDNTIRIWGVEIGDLLMTINCHNYEMKSITFADDGKQILSGSLDGSLRLWSVTNGEEEHFISQNINGMLGVIFNSSEQLIACYGSSIVKIIEVESEEVILDFESDQGGISNVQFSQNGNCILICCNMTLQLWDVANVKCLKYWKFHGRVTDFYYHPNGTLVLGFFDHSIECWQNIGKEAEFDWQLRWSTNIDSPNLFIEELNISNVMGLNDQNRRMLEQRGALLDPNAELSERRDIATLKSGVLTRINSPLHQIKTSASDLDGKEEDEDDIDLDTQSLN